MHKSHNLLIFHYFHNCCCISEIVYHHEWLNVGVFFAFAADVRKLLRKREESIPTFVNLLQPEGNYCLTLRTVTVTIA